MQILIFICSLGSQCYIMKILYRVWGDVLDVPRAVSLYMTRFVTVGYIDMEMAFIT